MLDRLTASRATLLVQIGQSTSSLAASSLLIAHFDSTFFGVYVLLQSTALLMLGMADSGLFTPLLVQISRVHLKRRIIYLRVYDCTVLSLLGVGAVTMLLILWCLSKVLPAFGDAEPILLIAASSWGAAMCLREWQRQRMLLQGKLIELVIVDTLGSAMTVSIIAIALLSGSRNLSTYVWASSAIGLIPTLVASRALYMVGFRPLHLRRIVQLGSWSFAAAQITWIQSQTYLYFAAIMLQTSAAGLIAAARLIFQPIQTIVTGLSRGFLAELAAETSQNRGVIARRTLVRFFSIAGIFFVAWLAFTLTITKYLQSALQARGYNIDSTLLFAWAITFYLSCGRALISQVVRAYARFRALAVQGAVGAVLSIITIPLAIYWFDATGAVAALAVVEAVVMLIALRLMNALTAQSRPERF